jgi:DNA invertase Pin-like site-specific DNA recombinase
MPTKAQAKHARNLIDGGENPRTVARTLGVDRATMYRHLAKLAD